MIRLAIVLFVIFSTCESIAFAQVHLERVQLWDDNINSVIVYLENRDENDVMVSWFGVWLSKDGGSLFFYTPSSMDGIESGSCEIWVRADSPQVRKYPTTASVASEDSVAGVGDDTEWLTGDPPRFDGGGIWATRVEIVEEVGWLASVFNFFFDEGTSYEYVTIEHPRMHELLQARYSLTFEVHAGDKVSTTDRFDPTGLADSLFVAAEILHWLGED